MISYLSPTYLSSFIAVLSLHFRGDRKGINLIEEYGSIRDI